MNFLGTYKYVVDFLVVAALVGLSAFGVHKYNTYQQDVGAARVQAQWDKATAAALEAQRTREIQFQKEKDDAIAQSAKDAQVALAAATAAGQSSRVLDGTIKALLAASAAGDLAANRKYTSALAEVFADCKDKYRELGREADGHVTDKQTLINAWPK